MGKALKKNLNLMHAHRKRPPPVPFAFCLLYGFRRHLTELPGLSRRNLACPPPGCNHYLARKISFPPPLAALAGHGRSLRRLAFGRAAQPAPLMCFAAHGVAAPSP
jgi:hypothetical protein